MRIKFSNIAFAIISSLLFSCSGSFDSEENIDTIVEKSSQKIVNVTTDFTMTITPWDASQQKIYTRMSASETAATRIALTIFDSNNTAVQTLTQRSDEADFGTFTNIRLSPGTYKFVVVAHKAESTESEAAIITSATEATIPGSILYEVYAATKNVTIDNNSYDAKNVSITVALCVTQLHLYLKDVLPTDTKKIRITVNHGQSIPESIKINPAMGIFATNSSFVREWKMNNTSIGHTIDLSVIAMFTEYPKNADVLIEGLDVNDQTIYSRTHTDIPFKFANVTNLSTNLFTGAANGALNFTGWGTDVTNLIVE